MEIPWGSEEEPELVVPEMPESETVEEIELPTDGADSDSFPFEAMGGGDGAGTAETSPPETSPVGEANEGSEEPFDDQPPPESPEPDRPLEVDLSDSESPLAEAIDLPPEAEPEPPPDVAEGPDDSALLDQAQQWVAANSERFPTEFEQQESARMQAEGAEALVERHLFTMQASAFS